MNAERLLALFERISEAPDAIPRLRRFILDLAVRGKLVKQDAEDEPAEEQLERIIEAKILHGRKSRATKKKQSDATAEADCFQLPDGWATAPLADLVSVLNGRAYKQSELLDAGTPVLRVGNLFTSNKWYYSDLELEDDKYCNDGDLIFAWSASFGPFIWNGGRAIYHYHIWKLPLHSPADLSRDYLYLYLLNKTAEIKAAGHGISMIHMTKEKMEKLEVPLPPLAEQHRIVAKVDELMALCDEMEASRTQREQCRERLVAASLQRLNQPSEDPETLRSDARFALQVLPSLTSTPAQIKQLRLTILSLAVRGKLVEQDPKDEPAEELLSRIATRRQELLSNDYPNADEARAQARKQAKTVSPVKPQWMPKGWTWTPLLHCSALVIDCKNKTAPYSTTGIPIVRTTNVRDGAMRVDDMKYVSEEVYELWSIRCKPQPGDLLITREAPMGEACIIPENMQICLGQRMMLARFVPGTINSKYLLYTFMEPGMMGRVQDKPVGATVQHLRVGGVETLLIPLPPLAEQHRIVARVDELMALCDQLEQQLSQAEQGRRGLLEAVLQEALADKHGPPTT